MKNLLYCLFFLVFYLPLQGQNLDQLKQQKKELMELYNAFAKADPSNKGAKLLAGKLVFLTNTMEDFSKSQDTKTWSELKEFSEDLVKESKKYNSDNAKKLQKLMLEVDKTIIKLEPKSKSEAKQEEKIKEKKTSTQKDTSHEPIKDTKENSSNISEEETIPSENKTEEKSTVKETVSDIPLQQPESYKSERELIFYALFAVMALFLIVLWVSVNGSVKKIQETMQSKWSIHENEIEHLEKILVEGSIAKGEIQKFKDEYEKKINNLETSTTSLFSDIDKKINELDKKIEIIDTAKANLSQLESLNVILHQAYVSKENLDSLLSAIYEKLKITDQTIRSQNVLSQVVQTAPPIQDVFISVLPDVVEALDSIKKKTNIQQLKELIDNQLPILSISKNVEDWNIHALAKVVQLCYVSAYNEGLAKPYEKLKESLKTLSFEIGDDLANRVSFTDFNADNIPYEEYIGMAKVRTAEYPSYIAVRQEVENNLTYVSAAPKTILFVLNPSIFYSANGAKTLVRKGEYIVKV